MKLHFVNRLITYENLLQEVIIYLTNGGFIVGTVAKVHRDFVTLSSRPRGAIDIPFSSILAMAPLPLEVKKKNKG